jgi:hypothetical protein
VSDALPDNARPLSEDEQERQVCAWSDFRKHYGVSATPGIRDREFRAFMAGWEAAWLEALS